MFDKLNFSQQLQEFANTIVSFIKARRREGAFFFLAAIFIGLSFKLPLPDGINKIVEPYATTISGIFLAIGSILFGYAVYRIYKLVQTQELPPPVNRPSAIKGPLAFTPADGELFRRLGREEELRKLLSYIQDSQTRMIVLMGASGVGKTSLLRAGLTHILKDSEIKYHYWEAIPTESGQGLLSAIQKTWQFTNGNSEHKEAAQPSSLKELVNPPVEFGKRLIVLDQFEQLGKNYESEIFETLRQVAREATPPYQTIWLIAFRREYRANWSDFIIPEQESGFYPAEFSLQFFSAEQARDVISQLVQAADIEIEEKVVQNLIGAATVDGEVSSVDIGIGLQVLSELYYRGGTKTLTEKDYHFAGGAEGLLTQYVSRCFDNFSDEDRKSLLNALLTLRDSETNQRIAEGKTLEAIAKESEATNIRSLKVNLERLTQRDMRLLERTSDDDENKMRYRLPHERLIPALNRLAVKIIGEAEDAKLKFNSAFAVWKSTPTSQYLLKGKILRQIERFQKQLNRKYEEKEKLNFLKKSQRHRLITRLVSLGLIVSLSTAGWLGYVNRDRFLPDDTERNAGEYLVQNGYPQELYDYQHQLKTLKIKEKLNLRSLPFLNSTGLNELELRASSSSNSIEGLNNLSQKLPNLTKLTLYISGSQVKDLNALKSLQNLTQLILDVSDSQVIDLNALKSLQNLTQLTLNTRFNGPDLGFLKSLPNLTQLNLDGFLSDKDLEVVKSLSNLTQLSLRKMNLDTLEILKALPNLTKLYLKSYEIKSFKDLEVLQSLPNLTQLTLELDDGGPDLGFLKSLPNSVQLILVVSNFDISALESLKSLKSLPNQTKLTLDLKSMSVKDLKDLKLLSNLIQL